LAGRKYSRLPDSERQSLLAEVCFPGLRGRISASRRQVATVQDDERMLRFVGSYDGPRLARSWDLIVPTTSFEPRSSRSSFDWKLGDLESLRVSLATGLEEYRKDYKAYYERCKNDPTHLACGIRIRRWF
jgi:rhamnose utilization protein RhaD (predicted bifunctional aldolase and dehydrogenase)